MGGGGVGTILNLDFEHYDFLIIQYSTLTQFGHNDLSNTPFGDTTNRTVGLLVHIDFHLPCSSLCKMRPPFLVHSNVVWGSHVAGESVGF